MAAAAALAACGGVRPGGEPARGSPAAAVSDYFRAVDRADGGAICAHLTAAAQRAIAQLQGKSCPKAMSEAARQLPDGFNAYEIDEQQVSGRTATVILRAGPTSDEVSLRQVGGEWRIADAPGLGLP